MLAPIHPAALCAKQTAQLQSVALSAGVGLQIITSFVEPAVLSPSAPLSLSIEREGQGHSGSAPDMTVCAYLLSLPS